MNKESVSLITDNDTLEFSSVPHKIFSTAFGLEDEHEQRCGKIEKLWIIASDASES